MKFRARLKVEFSFEAAHSMPNFKADHPNARIHGHSYFGEVVIDGPINSETGFVMSFEDLKARVHEVSGQLEHRYLNDIDGMPLPTSENLAKWIFDRLLPLVTNLREVTLRRPSIGMSVTYYGETVYGKSEAENGGSLG